MRRRDRSLTLYEPVLLGSAKVMSLDKADLWTRSWMHGPWLGSFTLYGEEQWLADYFYGTLGHHITETSGGMTTWEGFQYEMELEVSGSVMRRSYDHLANAVKAKYTDTADDTVKETSYYTQADSITRYGRREYLDVLDNYPQAAVEARCQATLKQLAWPWARRVGFRPPDMAGKPELRVSVAGYAFTANFKYVTAGDNATGNLSDWITDIAETDLQFLTIGKIETNTLQVKRQLKTPRLTWDVLMELANLGNASYNPMVLRVDIGRRLFYESMDTTPVYYWRSGKLYDRVGSLLAVNPWQVRPAVIRDMGYSVAKSEPGSMFTDPRDAWIDEIEVSDESGIDLRTPLSEFDILKRQQEYAGKMKEEDRDLRD